MSKIFTELYFPHDFSARQDTKIKNMLFYFRKESEEKAKAAVCIYWWIIEDMHQSEYPADKLDVFADDYRCEVSFLKEILEKFNLFRLENNCYVSDRVLKNISAQKEKSERAKKSAASRWNGKRKINEEFVNQIIEDFNRIFDKKQIVSIENKEKIYKITQENDLSLEVWKKIFENAYRGWNFDNGKKNVKPSLQDILTKWDAFASDDYYLAPDTKKQQREKEAEEEKKRKLQEEENRKIKEEQEARQNDLEKINDKKSAIKFINTYYPCLPKTILSKTETFKELSEKYKFSIDDVLRKRKENGNGLENK